MKTFTEPTLGHVVPSGRPSGSEATVLVIDDDPSMHDILAVLGSQHGFGIQFAEDGLDGLRLAEQNDVDLIVLDLHLPDLDGAEVIGRLRADPRTAAIPVVMYSADATEREVQRLLAAGAVAYLTKPAKVTEFLAMVDGILGKAATTPTRS